MIAAHKLAKRAYAARRQLEAARQAAIKAGSHPSPEWNEWWRLQQLWDAKEPLT